VLDAIGALPEKQRTVTALYYINGYSQREIADFLDVPTSTVKSRLHTSRQRLRERMTEMVRNALQSNALPESFAEETLTRAVEEAAALNKAHQFDEAEGLLRDVLVKTPTSAKKIQAAALRELNRTLMWSQYEDGRFDERWDDLVANGRAILASGSHDEQVWRELAETLMYIPRMPEAVDHLETWIAEKGPNPERVGKLAWAKGCVADYEAAKRLWAQHLRLAEAAVDVGADTGELLDTVAYTALTLVDCFAAANLQPQAATVTREAWSFCRDLGDITIKDFRSDADWIYLHYRAGLPIEDVTRFLIDKWSARPGAEAEGLVFCLRSWTDAPEALMDDWLPWLKQRVAAQDWELIGELRNVGAIGLRWRHLPDAWSAFNTATWELLESAPKTVQLPWQWGRFNVWAYFEAADPEGAMEVARRATEVMGLPFGGALQIQAAAALGDPTPPDLVHAVEEHSIEAVDSYGMSGWYLIAREAAVAGDKATAVEALGRTLSYWTNPPLGFLKLWENDAYWGTMADEPEVKALFAARRARIGPIYGSLHYFPGW
jgi:predicted DNA-binding protein YlxM (UPF0122 family)